MAILIIVGKLQRKSLAFKCDEEKRHRTVGYLQQVGLDVIAIVHKSLLNYSSDQRYKSAVEQAMNINYKFDFGYGQTENNPHLL